MDSKILAGASTLAFVVASAGLASARNWAALAAPIRITLTRQVMPTRLGCFTAIAAHMIRYLGIIGEVLILANRLTARTATPAVPCCLGPLAGRDPHLRLGCACSATIESKTTFLDIWEHG
jgi:hypothetical protein